MGGGGQAGRSQKGRNLDSGAKHADFNYDNMTDLIIIMTASRLVSRAALVTQSGYFQSTSVSGTDTHCVAAIHKQKHSN